MFMPSPRIANSATLRAGCGLHKSPAAPGQSRPARAAVTQPAKCVAGKATPCVFPHSLGVSWRAAEPGRRWTVARVAGKQQQAAADDADAAVLTAWDDGWGGPPEPQEDPAADIWFDYEVYCVLR